MERCPQCGADVTATQQANHTTCPRCGAALPLTVVKPTPGPPPLQPCPNPPTGGERAMLRVCFWLLLVSPPLAVAALVAKPASTLDVLPVALKSVMKQVMPLPAQLIAIAVVGAVCAAYCLARLHTAPSRHANMVGIIFAYTVALLFFDLCLVVLIAFVGCLLR